MGYGTSEGNDAYDGREKRALQYLVGLGEANKAGRIELPGCEPEHRWAFWNPTKGELEMHDADAAPREYQAADLESLRDILIDVGNGETRVFVADGIVEAILSEIGDRRDRVFCRMPYTAAWNELLKLRASSMKQADLIRSLRIPLAGCEQTGLLSKVRTLRLMKASDSESAINHGAESISLSAKKEASSGGQALPETAEFHVSIYEPLADDDEYDVDVKCVIDVDVDRGTLMVSMLPGEAERALRVTLNKISQWLGNGLREKGVLIWRGTPE